MTGETTPPSLRDFWNDMNRHANAEYEKVGDNYVVEVERLGGTWKADPTFRLVVWVAVTTGDGYAPPDGKEGNRYAWDAVGEKEYTEESSAKAQVTAFGQSTARVAEFCLNNPYEGPLSPYSKRVEEGDRA